MEGRHSDNTWMAGYAATGFKGDALVWHMRLDPDIQNDWTRLQQALAEKYLSEGKSTVSSLSSSTCHGFVGFSDRSDVPCIRIKYRALSFQRPPPRHPPSSPFQRHLLGLKLHLHHLLSFN